MRIMKVAIIAKHIKKAKQNKSPWGRIAHLNNNGFKWAFNRYRAIWPLGRITTINVFYTYFCIYVLFDIAPLRKTIFTEKKKFLRKISKLNI